MCTRIRCGIVQDIIYSHFKNSNCDALCDYASALVHAQKAFPHFTKNHNYSFIQKRTIM